MTYDLGADPALVASPSSPQAVSTEGFDPGAEVDMTVHSLWMDAGYLSVAPRPLLNRNRELIEEARERLNDALARIGA